MSRAATHPVEVVGSVPDTLGESPVWSPGEGCLYWVDLRAPALNRVVPGTGAVDRWPLPELVGAVVLRAGGLVLALRSGLFAFDPGSGALAGLVRLDEGHADNRLNDAKVDRRGVLWCSTMWDFGARSTGSLYRVAADLVPRRLRTDITIPNALAFSADGTRAYFADTPTGRIEVADLDATTGDPGPWRRFDGGDAPGHPDGATIDAEDHLWCARPGGGCLARFAPDGRLVRLIALPVSRPTSCAFGGSDLRTLFVTTSRQRLSLEELAAEPLAGRLLALDVGAKGIAEPTFRMEAR